MTTPKRSRRSTSAFRSTNTQNTTSNLWNRRFANKSLKGNHDDDIKIIFQEINSPKQDFFSKSTKDCSEINERYRKLMKEENELLQDLRKLQVKKQLLVKRSKELKDEQIIKLNIDLQKEKEVRNDLEKKLTNLEKKLNQLEKEIENRNRDKFKSNLNFNEGAKNPLTLNLKREEEKANRTKSKEDLKDKKKNSKEDLTNKKDNERESKSLTLTKKSNEESPVERTSKLNRLFNLSGLNSSQNLNNYNNQINHKQINFGSVNLTIKNQPKANLKSKTETSKLTKSLIQAKTNTETNTEPIDVEAVNLPKDQQATRNNLNNVIRDIIVRQNEENLGQTTTNHQANETTNNQNDLDILLSNSNATVLNASTQTNSDWSSNSSNSIQTPNSTTVNYSPSSSGNNSFLKRKYSFF